MLISQLQSQRLDPTELLRFTGLFRGCHRIVRETIELKTRRTVDVYKVQYAFESWTALGNNNLGVKILQQVSLIRVKEANVRVTLGGRCNLQGTFTRSDATDKTN